MKISNFVFHFTNPLTKWERNRKSENHHLNRGQRHDERRMSVEWVRWTFSHRSPWNYCGSISSASFAFTWYSWCDNDVWDDPNERWWKNEQIKLNKNKISTLLPVELKWGYFVYFELLCASWFQLSLLRMSERRVFWRACW